MRVSQDDIRNAIERYFCEFSGCSATVTTLAMLLGYTEHQIRAALAKLCARGALRWRRVSYPAAGGKGARWRYEYEAKQEEP